ncbi:dihydroorotate dehydrogenase [Clostridiisalibacter paucivorans]|uniref:dihydroorotate dehydrogenase n=1 Tax=Clostridiisalibacter paucivorans TaxID=408753 RepID=UPI00055454D9|nr:dihydroorotate dehydrogenase [Clostridiisalibacter paucivorans]
MDNRDINLNTNIGRLIIENPIITASGTFGFGREYEEFMDIANIGAISVKGLTLKPRKGNKSPRIAETVGGMLNSVGLENPGVEYFIDKELPYLKDKNITIIANISGNTIEEYCEMAARIDKSRCDAIEMNISCPNVKRGGVAFGTDKDMVYRITKSVRDSTEKPLIVKLSPNVTDIKEIALMAEKAGADGLSLINTLLGMAIDIKTKKPILRNNVGGLSGPAIKPIALRMVWEVAQVVKIPIIGMGGIMNITDVIEFLLAGASAVAIGTGNLVNPRLTVELLVELKKYMQKNNIKDVSEIIGKLEIYSS